MSLPRQSIDASVREFLAALSSGDAAHGSVSAAALAGGLGTALLVMVTAFPKTRSDSATDRQALLEASTALSGLQAQLIETIETETVVKLYAARSLPQSSASERIERDAKIQLALRAGADVPLEVMRLCATSLQQAQIVAERCSRAIAPEVQLGVGLIHVAFSGARSNLEMRLTSLTDLAHTKAVMEEIMRLSEIAADAVRAAESAVRVPPA